MATIVTFPKNDKTFCGKTTSPFTKLLKNDEDRSVDSSVQAVLAESLNLLSVEEREHVLEDIHGVADSFDESPSFVEHHLTVLDEKIGKINSKGRFAYELAESMGYQYVHNKTFRLMFLRADEFHVEKAAQTIMEHFQLKLELFGKDKLVSNITFDDLSIEDRASLCGGSYQSCFKDATERTVMFINADFCMADTFLNVVRAWWYQLMVALEDESTQRRGISWVIIGKYTGSVTGFSMKALKLFMTAVPARPAVVHIFPKVVQLTTLLPFLNLVGKKMQARIRFHFGESVAELLCTLQSFGINPNSVPLQHNGRPNTVTFLKWLENRKVIERRRRKSPETAKPTNSTGTGVLLPRDGILRTSKDILLGRGFKHDGNCVLDKILYTEYNAYVKASSPFEKTCVILATIKRVRESGARFLRQNERDEWEIADHRTIQSSVGRRFRTRLRRRPIT